MTQGDPPTAEESIEPVTVLRQPAISAKDAGRSIISIAW
jgi:hypothetical protein